MDNVIVTPHSLCWTDECFHNMASTGLASIVDALAGRRPEFVVNPDVLAHPRVRARRMRVTGPFAGDRERASRRERVALLRLADDVGARPAGRTGTGAASSGVLRSNAPKRSVVTLPNVSLSSIARGRLPASPMRTRSNPVSARSRLRLDVVDAVPAARRRSARNWPRARRRPRAARQASSPARDRACAR